MFDLIVSGPEPGQHLRQSLDDGNAIVAGREDGVDVCIDWESRLSRQHVRITSNGDDVQVEKLEAATNPVFHAGSPADQFLVTGGDSFVIGSTVFRIVSRSTQDSPQHDGVLEEFRYESGQLQHIQFSDADKRIEVLTHLPQVISDTGTEADFYLRIAQLLLAGIPQAEAVAIVTLDGDGIGVLHWDRRNETQGAVRPSTRLVREAVRAEGRSVLHVWEPDRENPQYTATAGFNWAFCVPVSFVGERCGLYVAGQLDPANVSDAAAGRNSLLESDVRFTELVAEIVSSLRRLSALERHQAGLRQFFAPPILEALGDDLNSEILEPRECEVTVLFCDLRGFSRQAESLAHDLTGLLSRVSQALGVMTEQILEFGGVTGDFQGDAALGFWGWPFASTSAPVDACRAALGIRAAFEEFSSLPDHPLTDFRMGIGIAHGLAVAGKIGTREQVKITVFGPVVNLASRLESMTSQLRVPVLLDELSAAFVQDGMSRSEGRTRCLGRVLPVGMDTPVTISELLPPEDQYPLLTDAHIDQYERGVKHFIAGQWEEAWQCLHSMPAGDRAQDFLSIPIVQNNRQAPADWDGTLRLSTK
jgi:adenylate cyclase